MKQRQCGLVYLNVARTQSSVYQQKCTFLSHQGLIWSLYQHNMSSYFFNMFITQELWRRLASWIQEWPMFVNWLKKSGALNHLKIKNQPISDCENLQLSTCVILHKKISWLYNNSLTQLHCHHSNTFHRWWHSALCKWIQQMMVPTMTSSLGVSPERSVPEFSVRQWICG